MYFTPTKLANLQIDLGSIDADSQALIDLIEDDKESKRNMQDGSDYFAVNNTFIESQDFQTFYAKPGYEETDDDASNNKLAHAFYRKSVNQKVEISLSNGVDISFPKKKEDDDKNNRDEKLENQVKETLGTDFDVLLIKWAKGASNHGLGWVTPYLNVNGELKFKIMDAREIIPIYSDVDPEDLLLIIRYYYRIIKVDDEEKKQLIVELWNKTGYEIFEENKDGGLTRKSTNPHFQFNTFRNGEIIKTEGLSWGRVPFIKLQNNDEESTDLDPIKTLIDDYDLHTSDFSNTLMDVADAVWSLVNYLGQDLAEFRENLKKLKVVNLDKDGSATPHTLDLPSEARNTHLDRLRQDIYSLGQSVDNTEIRFGDSPSGIALKLRYADVIMKSNSMLRYLESALYNLLWFVNKYYELYNSKNPGDKYIILNPKDAKFIFNLALPENIKEIVEYLNADKYMDQETIIAQHPLRLGQTPQKIIDKKNAEIEVQTEPFINNLGTN